MKLTSSFSARHVTGWIDQLSAMLCNRGGRALRVVFEAIWVFDGKFDRLWTVAERIGATAALLVVIGFGLFAIGEPVWRLAKMTLPN